VSSINGFLTGGNPPVFPVTRDAATLTLTDVAFNAFQAFDELTGGTVPARVTLTGTASFVVEPIAGRSETASNAASQATGGAVSDVFSVRTPVAEISDITMANGTMTIVNGTKTFNVTLSAVDLDAFAGSFTARGTNEITGTLTVDGVPVTIPAETLLVDPYLQSAFEDTYECNPDLNGDLVPVE
jgi:hypothetical protein